MHGLLLTWVCVFFSNFDYERYISTFIKLFFALIASSIPLILNKKGVFNNAFHFGFILSALFLIYIDDLMMGSDYIFHEVVS